MVQDVHSGTTLPFWRWKRASMLDGHFSVANVEAPDRLWLKFPRRFFAPPFPVSQWLAFDSVLVSTSWRTFHTLSEDAGVQLDMRVLADPPAPGTRDSSLTISRAGRWGVASSPFEQRVMGAEVVGMFRLHDIHPIDSMIVGGKRVSATQLVFKAEDVWKGSQIRGGDDVAITLTEGATTDTTWRSRWGGTPLWKDHRAILYLAHGRADGRLGSWSLESPLSYDLFGRGDTIVYSVYGGGVHWTHFRDRVHRVLWPLAHPWQNRIVGRIRQRDTPGAGLAVSVLGRAGEAIADSTGWFELSPVDIGIRRLRVRGPCGSASGLVEVNDERADTLDVRAPALLGPCADR